MSHPALIGVSIFFLQKELTIKVVKIVKTGDCGIYNFADDSRNDNYNFHRQSHYLKSLIF